MRHYSPYSADYRARQLAKRALRHRTHRRKEDGLQLGFATHILAKKGSLYLIDVERLNTHFSYRARFKVNLSTGRVVETSSATLA